MQRTAFSDQIHLVTDCQSRDEVVSAVRQLLDGIALPLHSEGLILLKPNLNNNLSALAGNATDLRLLAALVEALQQRGYAHIYVGDGSNIGVYRKGIDVFERPTVRQVSVAQSPAQ